MQAYNSVSVSGNDIVFGKTDGSTADTQPLGGLTAITNLQTLTTGHTTAIDDIESREQFKVMTQHPDLTDAQMDGANVTVRDDDAHARHLVPVPPLLEPVVEARLAPAHLEERVDEVGQPRAPPLQRERVRGHRGAQAEREGHEPDEDGKEEAPVAWLELAPRRRRPVRRRVRGVAVVA